MNESEDEKFEALLQYLRLNRGFDFTGYKRHSLMRRIKNRMQTVGIQDFEEYTTYLQVHSEEFHDLFNTILINVTSFFRDPSAWEYLSKNIIPKIIENKKKDELIRVWSVGCSSGEEPYTIAMVMAEIMGIEDFRKRVKIYATDVDEIALAQARHARYSKKALESVPSDLRQRYFEPYEGDYVFRLDLRRSIIFGRHDLVKDSPISKLDLLVCRNTLMYFDTKLQDSIVSRFHFAMKDDGYLFLGKSEMLLTHAELFRPINLKYHVFSKVPRTTPRDRLLNNIPAPNPEMQARRDKQLNLVKSAIDALPLAHVVVDMEGKLIMANEKARSLFGLATADLGRSFKDLELFYLPVELRSLIDKAYSEHQPVAISKVERHLPNSSVQYLNVQVTPLNDNGQILGVEITFDDMTASYKLQEEVERSKQDLETAYEELQSTNEELETTNEELQSTVEELETTNEELQSTNEEMETMNEELQSTNEELQTINDELQKLTDELNGANSFLQSVLSGIHSSVMVLDKSFNILSWNQKSEEMWGLRADEVKNKPFFGLEIGLPLEPLRTGILSSLKGEGDQSLKVVDAINRRGKAIKVSISTTPLIGSDGNRQGVILLVEETNRQTNGSAAK